MKNTLKESLDIIANMSQTTRNHTMAVYQDVYAPDFNDLSIDVPEITNTKLTVVLDPEFPLSIENGSIRLEFSNRKSLENFVNSTIDYLDYKSAQLDKETFDKQFNDQVELLTSLKEKLEKIDEQSKHLSFT